MSGISINIPGCGAFTWKMAVATAADLPASGNTTGDARVVIAENTIYLWNGSAWVSSGGALSVTDTASVDLTFSSNTLSATVLPAGVNHNALANLTTGDPHTQYALLAGRAGGQTLIGGTASGNSLNLQSTSNATKGTIRLDSTLDFTTDGTRNIGAASANRPARFFGTVGIQIGASATPSSIDGSLGANNLDFRTRGLGATASTMAHMGMFESGGGNRARLQLYNHGSNGGLNIQFNGGAGTCGSIGDFGDANTPAAYVSGAAAQNIAVVNGLIWDTDAGGNIGIQDANRPLAIYAKQGLLAGTVSNDHYAVITSDGPSGSFTTGRLGFGYSAGNERSLYLDQATGNLVFVNGPITSGTEVLRFAAGTIIPGANNTYDLGSTTGPKRFRDLFLAGSADIGSNLTISGVGNFASGSVGAPGVAVGAATVGLFRPTANILGFTSNGTDLIRLSGTQLMSGNSVSTFIDFNGSGVGRLLFNSVGDSGTQVGSHLTNFQFEDESHGCTALYGYLRMSNLYGTSGMDIWWQTDGGGDIGRTSSRPRDLLLNRNAMIDGYYQSAQNGDPGAQTNSVAIGAKDVTAGSLRSLHIRTEQAVAADIGIVSTNSLTVWINNVEYKIPLIAV